MTKAGSVNGITKGFRKQGRRSQAVLDALSRKAMREIQLQKIKQFVRKRWKPKEVADEIVRLHGSLSYSVKTIAYYRSKYLAEAAGVRAKRVGRPPREEVKVKILNLRQAGTRVSARRTSRLIREPRMTVYRHLKALGGNGRRCTRSLMCLHVVKRKKGLTWLVICSICLETRRNGHVF